MDPMTDTPARPVLIAHTAGHMTAAFGAARATGRAVLVRSAEGAAATLGAGVFAAMVEDARQAAPGAEVLAVLDCGTDAGAAMNAIRLGLPAIRLDAAADIMAKIRDMADAAGVVIDESAAPVLDLLGEPDPAAAAQAWIETAA